MKRMVLVFCAGWAVGAWGEDLTTLTGRTYRNIEVQRYDGEGFFIKHEAGISKISYSEIPASDRDRYRQMAPEPKPDAKPPPAPTGPVGENDLVTLAGQHYRNVVVRRVERDAVHIAHDSGLARVPFRKIPEDQHQRFRTPARPVVDAPAGPDDLEAADGMVYRNVQVRRIEPDGLTIQHDGGMTKLPYPLLPEDLQQKHEYDPAKAAQYQHTMATARAQAVRDADATRAQNQAERKRQIQAEPIRVFAVRADEPEKGKYRIRFSVRNNDDKPRDILVFPSAQSFSIPANSTRDDLEVTKRFFRPEWLRVESGAYTTKHILSW